MSLQKEAHSSYWASRQDTRITPSALPPAVYKANHGWAWQCHLSPTAKSVSPQRDTLPHQAAVVFCFSEAMSLLRKYGASSASLIPCPALAMVRTPSVCGTERG